MLVYKCICAFMCVSLGQCLASIMQFVKWKRARKRIEKRKTKTKTNELHSSTQLAYFTSIIIFTNIEFGLFERCQRHTERKPLIQSDP